MNKTKAFAFRLLLIYFFLQAFPLDWKYYQQLFAIGWTHLHYGGIFTLAHYSPRWSPGPQNYTDWGILFVIAFAGALLWTYIGDHRSRTKAADHNRTSAGAPSNDSVEPFDNGWYWVRVIARYRLAIAMIAYGFLKFFPLQAPYPSISNLNTHYGDFTRWKLFSLSLGIVPSYESFLGAVEIIGGLLLFYRRSASIGAFIIAIFLGNVFMSNLAYGGGDDVYSLYLLSLALFILSYDLQRLANLLVFQRPASPNRFQPLLPAKWQRNGRLALKTFFVFFFVLLYGFKTRYAPATDPYQFPTSKGLPGVTGIYNVTAFKIGKDTLAYSRTDSIRWQDLVFEKWATLSIRSNRPVVLDSVNVERPDLTDNDRTYELQGSAGRHYYSYVADTARHLLILQNKNPHYKEEKWVLHYEQPGDSRIILAGTRIVPAGTGISVAGTRISPPGAAPDKDSVYVVLDKLDKKYLLEEAAKRGRQGGLKL